GNSGEPEARRHALAHRRAPVGRTVDDAVPHRAVADEGDARAARACGTVGLLAAREGGFDRLERRTRHLGAELARFSAPAKRCRWSYSGRGALTSRPPKRWHRRENRCPEGKHGHHDGKLSVGFHVRAHDTRWHIPGCKRCERRSKL